MSIGVLQIGISAVLRTSEVHDRDDPLFLQRMQQHDLSAFAERVQDPELRSAVPDSKLVDSIAEVFGQRSSRFVSELAQEVQLSETAQHPSMIAQAELHEPATDR
jgi:hypothetical protein